MGHSFPFGSGAVWFLGDRFGSGPIDSWSTISEGPECSYAGNIRIAVWKQRGNPQKSVCEIKKSVQVKDTEGGKIFSVILVRDSVRNRMERQSSDEGEGLNANPVKSNGVNDVPKKVSADVWRRSGTRILKPVQIRLRSATGDDLKTPDSVVVLDSGHELFGLTTSKTVVNTLGILCVLIGLVTPRVITVTLFDEACERTATRDQWSKMCNCSPFVLCKNSSAILNFLNEKFGKTASVTKLTDVFQLQWTYFDVSPLATKYDLE